MIYRKATFSGMVERTLATLKTEGSAAPATAPSGPSIAPPIVAPAASGAKYAPFAKPFRKIPILTLDVAASLTMPATARPTSVVMSNCLADCLSNSSGADLPAARRTKELRAYLFKISCFVANCPATVSKLCLKSGKLGELAGSFSAARTIAC